MKFVFLILDIVVRLHGNEELLFLKIFQVVFALLGYERLVIVFSAGEKSLRAASNSLDAGDLLLKL
jgi:hypothetical protein